MLIGHSGVGKSTLVNALVPDADRAIGHVNAVTGRGRHTSTSAIMLPLPGEDGVEGWIIDTPGIRSFGLAHVQPEHLIEAFPDLDEMTEDCPRGCTHGADEPECGLDEAVERGDADPVRVESFRRLLDARSQPALLIAWLRARRRAGTVAGTTTAATAGRRLEMGSTACPPVPTLPKAVTLCTRTPIGSTSASSRTSTPARPR